MLPEVTISNHKLRNIMEPIRNKNKRSIRKQSTRTRRKTLLRNTIYIAAIHETARATGD